MELRWCDCCGKTGEVGGSAVQWWYSVETDEIGLCSKCKQELEEEGMKFKRCEQL